MRFSDEIEHISAISRDEAMRTGHFGICADHLMLAILRVGNAAASALLSDLGVDAEALKRAIDDGLFRPEPVPYELGSEVQYAESAKSAFNMAALEAMKCGSPVVKPEHLLAGICRCAGSVTSEWMKAAGADPSRVSARLRETAPSASQVILPDAAVIADEISRELESVRFVSTGNKIVS